MAQSIYRRDKLVNLQEVKQSHKEIATVEDFAKHSVLLNSDVRIIAQLIEKGFGIEVRDWDVNFGKAPLGNYALDFSITKNEFGTGAIGDYSSTFGLDTTASGVSSNAMGTVTTASGDNTVASGNRTTASGDNSSATGNETIAKNAGSNSSGKYNLGTSPNTIHETGIGLDESHRKNAFEIYMDGILKAPETVASELFSEMKALVTSEFVQEKISIENWFTDFTFSSGTIFRSDIPEGDKHANISAVFQGGIMLRPTKYTLINDGGFKSVEIGSEISLNEGDWISLQLNRVYYKDY